MSATDGYERAQWFNGNSGGGQRSFALYGVTKVHLVDPDPDPRYYHSLRALCGIDIDSRPSRSLIPGKDDPLCKRCERRAEARSHDRLIDYGIVPKEVLEK